MQLVIITIAMIIMTLPLLLIKTFSKIDNEIGNQIKASKKDIIIILIIAIAYTIITMLFNKDVNISNYINMTLLTSYLVFMSYTDQKTRLLYSIVSIAMIVIEAIWLLCSLDSIQLTKYDFILIPLFLVLLIMSKFRLLGFGDVLIYLVIILYELIYSYTAFWDIMFNLLIANALFVISSVIIRIVTKSKERHQPFTLYIAISTFMCNLFLI